MGYYASRRTLSDDVLLTLRSDEMNSRLACYRADLRASAEDAERYVTLWNQLKLSTRAVLISSRNPSGYAIAIIDA